MSVTYRIRDWDRHYENHETRKMKALRFCLVPNKHDGKGYRRVMAHPKACEVFAAWLLILQVASRCPVRGVLADGDGPLDAEDLSIKTGLKAAAFTEAFKVLTDPKVGWLEDDASNLPESPALPGDSPGVAGKAGPEGKGREGNRNEPSCACPESASPPSEPPPTDKSILTFPVVGTKGHEWAFRESLLAEFKQCFPSLDVLQQVRMALAWVKANPAKRKTPDGMRRFLTGWLNKAQSRGEGVGGKPSSRPEDVGTAVVGNFKPEDPEAAHRRWLQSRQKQGLPTDVPVRMAERAS